LVLIMALVGCSGSGGARTSSATSGAATRLTLSAPHHLVFLSDSGGWTVAEKYAALAEKALGSPVQVTDWATGGLTAPGALDRVNSAPEVVAAADIVLAYGSPEGTSTALSAYGDPCVIGAPTDPVIPHPDWAPYRAGLDKLYARIFELRRGKPTVIRAFDLYVPVIARWRSSGIETACTQRWEGFSGAVHQAAQARGITFVSVYDALNGTRHDQDPVQHGYIGADGQHTTPSGAQVIADALAASGFVPILPG
jgi:hypothetical protein